MNHAPVPRPFLPSSPPPDPSRTRRALKRRFAVLLCFAGLGACGTDSSDAHDWVSPVTDTRPAATPSGGRQDGPVGAWPHRVWAGPSAGMPAAPSARDCHRPPTRIELDAPGWTPAVRWGAERRGERATGLAAPSMRSSPPAALLASPSPLADRAVAAKSGNESAAESAAPPPVQAPPSPRPRDEPVTAGVIDDNADFGEYLAYRQRHAGLPVRDRDIEERYRLTVHDAAGRPVPDAEVRVYAGAEALPLWARTDSGGQVWLHPRAAAPALAAQVLEVQVTQGGRSGRALLKRGQRDQLQVRLDGAAPLERARLDLVFLVDATGSMGDEIRKLERSMQAMTEQIAHLPSHPDLCLGLVTYRDRGDDYFVRAHDFTDRLDAFQRVLGQVQAEGGGDMPEALDEALHTAVHRLAWRGDGATRLIVLVADAPPHLDYGAPWYDDDMQGALARGIKLHAVGASGLDPVGEYVFRQIAQYTGGRFVFLTYADAADPASGPGRETVHDVGNYAVESLDKLVVRLVREELARRPA